MLVFDSTYIEDKFPEIVFEDANFYIKHREAAMTILVEIEAEVCHLVKHELINDEYLSKLMYLSNLNRSRK